MLPRKTKIALAMSPKWAETVRQLGLTSPQQGKPKGQQDKTTKPPAGAQHTIQRYEKGKPVGPDGKPYPPLNKRPMAPYKLNGKGLGAKMIPAKGGRSDTPTPPAPAKPPAYDPFSPSPDKPGWRPTRDPGFSPPSGSLDKPRSILPPAMLEQLTGGRSARPSPKPTRRDAPFDPTQY